MTKSFSLFGYAAMAYGQAVSSVKQTAIQSPCANIVALAGAKIDCSNLTPTQAKLIEKLPGLLTKILGNLGDLKVVSAKVDELSEELTRMDRGMLTPGPIMQSNSGGTNILQGTNGPNSPIINSPIMVGDIPPPPRTIAPEKAQMAVAVLRQAPSGSIVKFRIIGGSPEIYDFANRVAYLFASAGWTIGPVSAIGNLVGMEAGPTGNTVTHGEGFRCWGNVGGEAYEMAKRAMQIAGYACKEGPLPLNGPPGESILLQIGTRIPPPD